MSLVNQFLSQTYERCRRQPPSIQVTVCVTVAAVMILVAGVTGWQRAHSHEPLFVSRDVTDNELPAIEAAFGKAGLTDYYRRDGQILVPRQQRGKFMQAIQDAKAVAGRPDEQYQQELTRNSLLESQSQRQARVQMGIERWIAACLREMPEVDEASVHFDEVELGGLRRERMVRAMVAVRSSAAGTMTAERIQAIRELVCAGKALLEPQHVTVTDLRTGISYAGDLTQAVARLHGDELLRQKTRCESEWREKIRAAVAFIPGVEVITNVQLSQPDLAREQTGTSLVPIAVNASVRIPHSYYHRVRQTRGPRFPEATPDSASIQRIEQDTIQSVEHIVGGLFPPDTDTFHAQVVVATFTDLAQEPWNWGGIDFWVQRLRLNPTLLISVFGLAAMAMWLALGIWRDVTARRLPPTIAMPQPGPTASPDAGATMDEAPPEPRGESQEIASHEIVHRELTRLVREDPETAAEMLGEWVRKAG